MLEVLHLSSLTKYFDSGPRTKTAPSSTLPLPTDAQLEAESQPLAPDDVEANGEEAIPLEQSGDMGRTFDDTFVKPEGRTGDALAQIIAIVSVAVFLVTTWIVTFLSGSSYLWFAWHPLLLSSSIALFTYGVLTLQPTSQAKTKVAGLVRHQLAMIVLGVPAALLGFLAVFFTKIAHDRPHFTSWHGLFGIITVGLLVLQVILGGGSVWFNGALFGGNPQAKLLWKYHRAVGYATFCFLLLTAHLGGAWSNWSKEHSEYIPRVLAYTFAPVALIVSVFFRMRTSKMQFF
ncbi:hypothetical protein EIP86_008067 [Pleurotus ostreatoroseus]|nr:hypothetical protein EIP86_008067 [Pleurotus ostreatoroseus]